MAAFFRMRESYIKAMVYFLLFFGSVVAEKPKVEPFSFAPRKQEIGSTVRTLCSVSQGDLPLTITWLHDGKKIERDNVEIKHFDEMSKSIKIVSIDVRDIGNYTCVATNSAGFDSYTLPLKFQGPPKWTSSPPEEMDVLTGQVISINCHASGYPYPIVTWRYGPNLPPAFVQTPTDQDVLRGSTVSFHCLSKGYPRPQVLWYNPDSKEEIMPNDVRKRLWENGTLTISDVTTQDSGQYTCEVNNGVGQPLKAITQLRVHEPPIMLSEFQTVSSKRGEATKIKCRAEGEAPIVWEWSQGERLLGLPHSDRFETSEERKAGYVASELVIRETKTEDAGIYKCKAKNRFGEASGTLQLVVLEPPKPPSDVKLTETGSRFARLSWRPSYSESNPVIHYIVRFWTNDGKGRRLREVQVPAATTTVLNKLHPGVTYYATIVAENSVGSGNPSPAVEFKTTEEEPSGPPTDISIHTADSTSLKITWKPPPRDTWNGRLSSYQVGYRKHGTELAYRFEMVRVSETRNLELVLTSLDPSTRYDIIVRAMNQAGMGPWSPETLASTSSGNPPKMPVLKIVSSTSHTLLLEWDVPGHPSPDSVKQFLLEYGKAGKMDQKVHIPGNKRKLLLRGLESNLRYELRMASYNEHGQSPFSPVVSETTMELSHEAMTQENEATPFYLRLYFIVPVAVSVTVVVSTLVVAWACVARTRALEAASHLLRDPIYDYKQPMLHPQNGSLQVPSLREHNINTGPTLDEAYDVPWDMTLGDGSYTRLGGDGRRTLGHPKNDQNRRSR